MELIYTWSELKAIKDRIEQIGKQTDSMTLSDATRYLYNKLWSERHHLEDVWDEKIKQVIPDVGMPCTVRWYSDSSGAHVEKILSPKTIQVKCDGLYSCTKIFTYRRSGHWVEKGPSSRDWSTRLSLGYRHDYYDMSF